MLDELIVFWLIGLGFVAGWMVCDVTKPPRVVYREMPVYIPAGESKPTAEEKKPPKKGRGGR